MMNVVSTFSLIAAFLSAFITPINALKIGRGLVRVDDQNFDIYSTEIPLNLTDTKLSIGFTLVDDEDAEKFLQPEQVMISLSAPNIVSEYYMHPTFVHDKVFEANVAISDLSKCLLNEEEIFITVITGDPNDKSFNRILNAGTLNPSDKLRKDKAAEFPKRLQQNPEIKHVFREPPKNLPGFISTQFAILLIIAFVVLLFAWSHFDAININNLGKFDISTYIFIASIFAFEYTFFDYYMGTSIFTTLYRFAILSTITLFFGSKCLKTLYKLRQDNLR